MTTTRIQLALNVDDIAEATEFYTRMFGVAPHKQREGYANFAIEDPPLKLVLFQSPGASERLNHLGIETQLAAGDRGTGPVHRGRAGNPGDRAGRVLPRRPAQGVRHRPGRPAGLVGVPPLLTTPSSTTTRPTQTGRQHRFAEQDATPETPRRPPAAPDRLPAAGGDRSARTARSPPARLNRSRSPPRSPARAHSPWARRAHPGSTCSTGRAARPGGGARAAHATSSPTTTRPPGERRQPAASRRDQSFPRRDAAPPAAQRAAGAGNEQLVENARPIVQPRPHGVERCGVSGCAERLFAGSGGSAVFVDDRVTGHPRHPVRQPFLIIDRAQVLMDPQQYLCNQILG